MSLWDSVKRTANKAAAEAEKTAAIARLSMEVKTTRGEIKDKLEELGHTALGLYREGTIDHGSLESVVLEIGKLEAKVTDLEGQIAAQKAS